MDALPAQCRGGTSKRACTKSSRTIRADFGGCDEYSLFWYEYVCERCCAAVLLFTVRVRVPCPHRTRILASSSSNAYHTEISTYTSTVRRVSARSISYSSALIFCNYSALIPGSFQGQMMLRPVLDSIYYILGWGLLICSGTEVPATVLH